MPYRKRIVEPELGDRLSSTGSVVIEGPTACGKTTTARRYAASEVLLDIDESARRGHGQAEGPGSRHAWLDRASSAFTPAT